MCLVMYNAYNTLFFSVKNNNIENIKKYYSTQKVKTFFIEFSLGGSNKFSHSLTVKSSRWNSYFDGLLYNFPFFFFFSPVFEENSWKYQKENVTIYAFNEKKALWLWKLSFTELWVLISVWWISCFVRLRNFPPKK